MKSSKSKGKNNARHKKFKRPTSGGGSGGWKVRLFPCLSLRVGKEQGQGIGVLDAMHADTRDKGGKNKCGWVKGRLR